MTTLQAQRVALDENAIIFISVFMTQVERLTEHDTTRVATTVAIENLLRAAIERDGDASSEWRALYRAIANLVDAAATYAHDAQAAYRYFRDFIGENDDLADA